MPPAYDVIAQLRGVEPPDEWIIRGNHHDAWVCGADDPISGLVVLLEEARVLAELARSGWQPKRTVVFAAWDAEEPGLLGSTEWVEAHAAALREHAVAYVNGDDNERGFLRAGGSHTLQRLVSQIAQEVTDPERKVSVAERARASLMVHGSAEEKKEAREHAEFRLHALGSGSDFTPFLQHLGIASLDLRYGGEGEGGSYHSIYDSFEFYTRFVDPTFAYGIALAQTSGRAVLRLCNADMLPFEFTPFADSIARYLRELAKLAEDMRDETQENNRLISDRALELAADPTQVFVPPSVKPAVPYFNFAPLQNAAQELAEASGGYAKQLARIESEGVRLPLQAQRNLDQILMRTERLLTRDEGLPRRPWYRHMVYAPGYYTGYSVKTLPGVREAIEERQWNEVNDQIQIAAKTIERFAAEVQLARKLISAQLPP